MAGKGKQIRKLMGSLDRVERCLFLAETTVSVLQDDVGAERDSLVTELNRDIQSALAALAMVRGELKTLDGQSASRAPPDLPSS
jgi:hypothetical protein